MLSNPPIYFVISECLPVQAGNKTTPPSTVNAAKAVLLALYSFAGVLKGLIFLM